ncbi:TasA family protein [Blastococcus brunescens]|uniref:TasA family protein n=1 Tax=Blastococcus brunescens TaxID=1564165 RepID=A0ABZ1B5N2_9ACTN|nr:TasA family protein [Blastococcus sp. BMG 8361]WRL65153.1 TasA family protein [Blastococcus sp. BMG 8361]
MSTKTIAASSTARKVVGSLGVIGAAAAVAGMGTFGTFTDSTTPVTSTIASGKVDIDVSGPAVTVPVNRTAFVPGDSVTGVVNLVNKGTAELGSVSLVTSAGASNLLATNPLHGLQLTLQSCPVAWAADNTCASGATVLSTGAAVGTRTLSNPASLAVNGTDYLAFTISLPVDAGNEYQGLSNTLSLKFDATQRTGTVR